MRGEGALPAWKLGGRGTVVDDVVIHGSGVVGGSSGVYRRIRGETVNTQQAIANNARQYRRIVNVNLTLYNARCSEREFIWG